MLGAALAYGIFSDQASASFPEDRKTVVETYYNARLTNWSAVSPSIQYITNPGGNRDMDQAVIVSVRAQISF
ncbi:MAG: hypothetical protein A2Y76_11800 [Planctomycetes bacterium RBG_13_60_9]|nr:MAG: hypothetical protein A2Y76_11800 [Planctomycetes bacterium RBG_13_60_9]